MVGVTTGDNRFGPSSFVVGPTLGNGCNYAGGSGLQQAMNDCSAAGGGTVYIRPNPSGNYTVNLTWPVNVHLVGCVADITDIFPTFITIKGTHTVTYTGGGTVAIGAEHLFFTTTGISGDLFTLSTTVASSLVNLTFGLTSCNLQTTDGNTFVCSPASTSSIAVTVSDTFSTSTGNGFQINGTGGTDVIVYNGSTFNCSTTCVQSNTSGATVEIDGSTLTSPSGVATMISSGGGGNFIVNNSTLQGGPIFDFDVTGGNLNIFHSTLNLFGATDLTTGSGNFVYGDILSNISPISPGSGVLQFLRTWGPYGKSGVSSGVTYKGTAGFDSTDFTVTDGFVQVMDSMAGSGTTVGDATADLITIPLGATPKTFTIRSQVSGFSSSSGSDGAGFEMVAMCMTDGATASILGVPNIIGNESSNLISTDAMFVASGNNIIIRVQGTLGFTVVWAARARYTRSI